MSWKQVCACSSKGLNRTISSSSGENEAVVALKGSVILSRTRVKRRTLRLTGQPQDPSPSAQDDKPLLGEHVKSASAREQDPLSA